MPARKNREPSKCREWERERRNRLNEAFSQLRALLAEHAPPLAASHSKGQANLAKIEIIQKAVIFLKDLIHQKLQLDAKLLAAQTEVTGYKDTSKKKDVSTQINKILRAKTTGGLKKKIIWKETARKEKRDASMQEMWKPSSGTHNKLPKLLPKCNLSDRDVLEKRMVVLPATPYLLPHRPLLLPPAPPTFYVVEPFTSSMRSNMPIMPRIVSEITKTTMVNNIPIAAYSFPLSVAKNKKMKTRDKITITNRSASQKRRLKVVKTSKKLCNKSMTGKENKKDKESIADIITCSDKLDSTIASNDITSSLKEHVKISQIEYKSSDAPTDDSDKERLPSNEIPDQKNDLIETENSHSNKITENTEQESSKKYTDSYDRALLGNKLHQSCSESNGIVSDKSITDTENINKDKIESILDTSICDNTVDGGNARLELAEEFLAASPTAAFLMTFPLVSGVRADTPIEDEQHSLQATAGVASSAVTIAMSTHSATQKGDAPSVEIPPMETFFDKSTEINKPLKKIGANISTLPLLFTEKQKLPNKSTSSNPTYAGQSLVVTTNSVGDHSFLNLLPPVPSSAAAENVFSLDFDGNFPKNTTSTHSYLNSSNLLFKNDPLNGKSNNVNIYPSNNLSTGHEYNGFGLYPCAVEKYSNKINNDDNFMKIGSARLSYDLDLGLPQKPYEFTSSASVSNLAKENVFTPGTAFTSSYHPFNSEFHMQLATSSANNTSVKKANMKPNPFYTDTITNLYSQPSTMWPEEYNLYGNNTVNGSKNVKQHNYNTYSNQILPTNQLHKNIKHNPIFDSKIQSYQSSLAKPSKLEVNQLIMDKNKQKSPNKSHINWMTSEVRPSQNNHFDALHNDYKDPTRMPFPTASNSTLLPHLDYNTCKKFDHMETNFFPISMPNISTHATQEDVQLWPSTRPLATAEISLDPPPINLPTLVGDLALGPHERRKSVDRANRGNMQPELPSCNSFLSVSQLMNRSTDAPSGRLHTISNDNIKHALVKNNHLFTYPNVTGALGYVETDNMQPCYFFNDSKTINTPGSGTISNNTGQLKQKSHKVPAKSHKNNYSAEALLKGGHSVHKTSENVSTIKFTNASQKYAGFNASQDSQTAQVSHFPSIADYPEASYSQSYASTGLYTPSTGGPLYGNLMAGGGGSGGGGAGVCGAFATSNFTPDFVDFGPIPDCNFTYPRFDNFKIKNIPDASNMTKFPLDIPKTAQKEAIGKHKTEYSKKDSSKKMQSKRPKMSTEMDSCWMETPETSLQSKQAKRSSNNIMSDELTFSNYLINQGQVMNQVYPQHVPEPAARPAAQFPVNVARTNFNLSTIFPEIAKKVQ